MAKQIFIWLKKMLIFSQIGSTNFNPSASRAEPRGRLASFVCQINLINVEFTSTISHAQHMLWPNALKNIYLIIHLLKLGQNGKRLFKDGSVLISFAHFRFRLMIWNSQVAGPMCPVLDPAMVTTVNFFHGNVFYMARRAKLAWLLLA